MTLKTILAAVALTLSPMLASAACWDHSEQQAMSCAEGSVFDEASNSCVVVAG